MYRPVAPAAPENPGTPAGPGNPFGPGGPGNPVAPRDPGNPEGPAYMEEYGNDTTNRIRPVQSTAF